MLHFKHRANLKEDILGVGKVPLSKVLYISLFIVFINLLAVFLLEKNIPPEVPLFYGLPEGGEQLASYRGLFIPGATSLLIILMNLGIALMLKDEFLQKTLILSGLAVSVLSMITTTKIILLVGSF